MAGMTYIKVFTTLAEVLEEMPDDMAGQLIKAMLAYAGGKTPDIPPPLRFVWVMIRQQLDRDVAEYEEKAAKLTANGSKGGRPSKDKKQMVSEKPNGFEKNQMVSEKTNCLQEEEKEKDKEKDKEEDKDKEKEEDNTSLPTMGGGGEDKLLTYARENLTGMNGETLKELTDYRKSLPDELIAEAITETLRSGTRSFSYTVKILERCQKAGYRSAAEFRADKERRGTAAAGREPKGNGKQMVRHSPDEYAYSNDLRAEFSKSGRKPMITREVSEAEFGKGFYTDVMAKSKGDAASG